MRAVEVQESDYEDDVVGVAHWRGAPETIFEVIDDQLAVFGLEVVLIDEGGSDYMWRIERRAA
jgi:hypothetical protein